MTETEILELRKLAEAAPNGPWTVYASNPHDGYEGFELQDARGRLTHIDGPQNDRQESLVAFIAATNPQVILSLLSELDSLKGRVRELEEGVAGMLDIFVGYCCPEVDAAISVMQKVGVDRWSMKAQMESVFAIPD